MADWVIALAPVFREAVDAMRASPAAGAEGSFYRQLLESSLPDTEAGAVTQLLTHVLSGESRGTFWYCTDAIALTDRVVAAGSDAGLLREQLLRLHCRGAMD